MRVSISKGRLGVGVVGAGAVAVILTAGCQGAPLGGGTGGLGGDTSPCTPSGSCIIGTGGSRGVGGSGGSGGSGAGGSGTDCDQLVVDYKAALTAALACTPGAPNQCQTLVATSPTACPDLACGGQAYVNDGTTLESVRESWIAACFPPPVPSCPANVCDGTTPVSTCVPDTSNPAIGTCLPSPGESCDQLAAEYAAAVTAAKACTLGAANQCQVAVNSTPSVCAPTGCDRSGYVNDTTGVAAALARWISQCGSASGCPQIVCEPPPAGEIVCAATAASDGGAPTGICSVMLVDAAN